jgi:predicted transcriptional regulator
MPVNINIMIDRQILKIAREKIGLYFSNVIKEKKIAIEKIERDTKLSKTIIYKILQGKGYSIDSFLTLCAYFDTHLELSEKSIENSIINQIKDSISDN